MYFFCQVRGAPAIAIVGCLSLAVELNKTKVASLKELEEMVNEKLEYLVSARPTAVNMNDAAIKGKKFINDIVSSEKYTPEEAKSK